MMVSHPKGGVGRRTPTAASCPSTQAQPDKDRMVPLKEHPLIPAFLQGLKLQCWQSFVSSEPSSPELKCPCPQNPRFTRFYLLGLDLSYWVWIFSSSSAQQLLPQKLSPELSSCSCINSAQLRMPFLLYPGYLLSHSSRHSRAASS